LRGPHKTPKHHKKKNTNTHPPPKKKKNPKAPRMHKGDREVALVEGLKNHGVELSGRAPQFHLRIKLAEKNRVIGQEKKRRLIASS